MVGLTGFVTDVGLFNLLRFGDGAPLADKPVTAKIISVVVATIITYIGNRQLTWRHRPRGDRRRELVLFFVFNGIGLLISVGCLAVSHYVLGLTSQLADNLSANGVGLVLGTTFRFWAYRTFVFPPEKQTAE
ncbi:MAG: GtrA family protein [Nocardioidaceae bacterium]|nr:GtrA family protein [Nocardioidaceae bacterium]